MYILHMIITAFILLFIFFKFIGRRTIVFLHLIIIIIIIIIITKKFVSFFGGVIQSLTKYLR